MVEGTTKPGSLARLDKLNAEWIGLPGTQDTALLKVTFSPDKNITGGILAIYMKENPSMLLFEKYEVDGTSITTADFNTPEGLVVVMVLPVGFVKELVQEVWLYDWIKDTTDTLE